MKTNRILARVVIASVVLAVTMLFAITPSALTSSGKNTLALAQQQSSASPPSATNQTMDNMTTTTTSAAPTPTTNASSANKTFYLFNSEVEGVNQTRFGIRSDVFALQTMVVNKGDSVTVHFYNVEEEADERHSFIIGSPYNVDEELAGGENTTVTFTADHEGVFQYFCRFHPPEMIGQLVVLPTSTSTSSSPSPE